MRMIQSQMSLLNKVHAQFIVFPLSGCPPFGRLIDSVWTMGKSVRSAKVGKEKKEETKSKKIKKRLDKMRFPHYNNQCSLCESGGIGRRASLRC